MDLAEDSRFCYDLNFHPIAKWTMWQK